MEYIYQCPVCKQRLELINKSFVCNKNHSFDISRDGYTNLLLANQKNTLHPGDAQLMVESRNHFLEQGYYDPLFNEINAIILKFIRAKTKTEKASYFHILDVGCGVGIYSGELQKKLSLKKFKADVRLWGLDISKPAILKASKKYRGIQFSIGSSFHLPYLDESFDVIFSIFSPFDSRELFRVLKPGGKILVVRPGPNHLRELATFIYGNFQLQGNPINLTEDLEIPHSKKHRIAYEIHLKNNQDIMSLVNMTPYHWHLSPEKTKLLTKMNSLKTSVDFELTLFEKPIVTKKVIRPSS